MENNGKRKVTGCELVFIKAPQDVIVIEMQVHKASRKKPKKKPRGTLIPREYTENFTHQANTGEIKMVKNTRERGERGKK